MKIYQPNLKIKQQFVFKNICKIKKNAYFCTPIFMDKIRNYNVSFSGLKEGRHTFQFEIEKTFLELFDTEREFENPNLLADVVLQKHSTFLEFEIKVHGTVELICDLTTEAFNEPIENEIKILVKFGEEYDDSDEDIITIPRQDHEFNISQLVYEAIVLAVPMKKISPNISDEDLSLLDQYSSDILPTGDSNEEEEPEIDPRWDALKKLKK